MVNGTTFTLRAVEVAGLVKAFGRTRALDGLDLTVGPGEVHGFLGPNGAGKSTTIRVLLGLLRSDSGTARVLGAEAIVARRTWDEGPIGEEPGRA